VQTGVGHYIPNLSWLHEFVAVSVFGDSSYQTDPITQKVLGVSVS
jgi:hypothetical protein